jgi:hypothetical protein
MVRGARSISAAISVTLYPAIFNTATRCRLASARAWSSRRYSSAASGANSGLGVFEQDDQVDQDERGVWCRE